jgi:hypothetical protein
VTPAAYVMKADEIRLTRKLKPHQNADLNLQVRLVQQRGCSTLLDDYYLEICGIPPTDWGHRKPQKIPGSTQGSLF